MHTKHVSRPTVVFLAGLFLTTAAFAREVWVVQFETPFPSVSAPCRPLVRWQSHLLLHNTGDEAAVVRLLEVSNGERQANAADLVISPHRTFSVRGTSPGTLHWSPVEYTPLWVSKLEVPDGVVIANRTETEIAELVGEGTEPPCDTRSQFSAGLPMRIFGELTAPGVGQHHLATDIGNYFTGPSFDSRFNVGVYNASDEPATATVRVTCSSGEDAFDEPDPVVSTIQLTIPPRTAAQTRVLASTVATPCPIPGPAPYHVIVTADQPSLSFVTGISNEATPKFPAATSITY